MTCVRSYRESMAEFSRMKTLELWYFAIGADELVASIKDPSSAGGPATPSEGTGAQRRRGHLSEAGGAQGICPSSRISSRRFSTPKVIRRGDP